MPTLAFLLQRVSRICLCRTSFTFIDINFILKNDLSADIRYADHSTLLSTIFEKLQLSTKELENACRQWGMKIRIQKFRETT